MPRKNHFSFSGLLLRGWNKEIIKKLLGEPDVLKKNPHYSSATPMKCFDEERVKEAEKTITFQNYFLNKFGKRSNKMFLSLYYDTFYVDENTSNILADWLQDNCQFEKDIIVPNWLNWLVVTVNNYKLAIISILEGNSYYSARVFGWSLFFLPSQLTIKTIKKITITVKKEDIDSKHVLKINFVDGIMLFSPAGEAFKKTQRS